MFRFGNGRFLVGRLGVYRNYSKEKKRLIPQLQDKYYIVKVKNDQSSLVKARKLNQQLPDDFSIVKKGDHWYRLRLVLGEIFDIYKNQFWLKMEELQVNEKVVEMKKRQMEKLSSALTQENIKKIVEMSQDQLKILKDSKNYEKIKNQVQKIPGLTKDAWILLQDSKFKEHFIYCVKLGGKGAIEVLKFIKHVYKAPSKQ